MFTVSNLCKNANYIVLQARHKSKTHWVSENINLHIYIIHSNLVNTTFPTFIRQNYAGRLAQETEHWHISTNFMAQSLGRNGSP